MCDVIDFDGITSLDINPDKVLESAKELLDMTLVIGYDKEDRLYVASSTSQLGELVLVLERAKQFLLEQ